MKKVFIDGKAGITGLQIYQRLGSRKDIQVLTLPEEQRKDPNCRRDMFGQADVVFLLTAAGVLSPDALLTCFSLTGYSGGGKKMIAQYEQEKNAEMDSPAIYAIGQGHKHLPEMRKICGLDHAPVFCPAVDDYYKGMATTVSFHADQLKGINGPEGLRQCLAQHYAGQKLVQVAEAGQGVIHGGGPEITELLHKIGKETQFVDGLRVTDQETVEAAQMVLCGKINKSLVNLLQCCGGKAMGLSGLDGHMILAKQKDTRLGFVGGDHQGGPPAHSGCAGCRLYPRGVHHGLRRAGQYL